MGKYEKLQLFKLDPWQKSRDKRNMVEPVSIHACRWDDYSLLLSQKIRLKNRQSICTKRNFYYICMIKLIYLTKIIWESGECGVQGVHAVSSDFCDIELLFQNV